MLTGFSVKGFKNFDKEFSIDFSDVRDYKFHTELVTNGVLNTAVIYGKNAAGKSNFGLALFDIVSHLTMNNVTPGLYDYYLNVNSMYKQASFKYEFAFGEDDIFYAYSKSGQDSLTSEFLILNDIVIFHRSSDIRLYDNNGLVELAPNLNWDRADDMSPLKYLFYNSPLDSNHPISKMMVYVNNMLWFRSLDENRFIGFKEKSNDFLLFCSRKIYIWMNLTTY